MVILKKYILLLIIGCLFICCSLKSNIKNKKLWEKVLIIEKNKSLYQPNNIVIYEKTKSKNKETESEYIINYRSNKYHLVNGYLNGSLIIPTDTTKRSVKRVLNLVNKNRRSSLLIDNRVKSIVKETKNEKKIEAFSCKEYKFINIFTLDDKKIKEIGSFWVDINSGNIVYTKYKQKYSILDTSLIPMKSSIESKLFYSDNILNEVKVKIFMKVNLPIIGVKSELEIIEMNFKPVT